MSSNTCKDAEIFKKPKKDSQIFNRRKAKTKVHNNPLPLEETILTQPISSRLPPSYSHMVQFVGFRYNTGQYSSSQDDVVGESSKETTSYDIPDTDLEEGHVDVTTIFMTSGAETSRNIDDPIVDESADLRSSHESEFHTQKGIHQSPLMALCLRLMI